MTLAELVTEVRRRADMESTQFVTDTEIQSYINNSACELYDLLVAKYEDYFVSDPLSFTVTSSAEYSLPSDFYKLRAIDREDGSDSWEDVKPFTLSNRNNVDEQSDVRYRILGSKIRFYPPGSAAGSYRLWYVPRFTRLVNTTDALSGVIDFEEYVIVDSAIKCLTKEESDTSALQAAKAFQLQRVMTMASGRDSANPVMITDVTGLYK